MWIKKIWFSPWVPSTLAIVLYSLSYLLCGFIFSQLNPSIYIQQDLFLNYMTAALGIQIPIFILFLETMRNSGHVYKVVLPKITEFREITTVLFMTMLFVFIAPNQYYLILPIGIFLYINGLAIKRAFDIIYRIDRYSTLITKSISGFVEKAFVQLFNNRMRNNQSLEWVKSKDFIDRKIYSSDSNGQLIESNKKGYFVEVNRTLFELTYKISNLFYGKTQIDLNVLHGVKVELGHDLMMIKSDKKINEIILWLYKKSIKIEAEDYRVETLNRVMDDFEMRFTHSLGVDGQRGLRETLKLYEAVVDPLDAQVTKQMVANHSNYTLDEAFNDTQSRFLNDSLGKLINRASTLLLNAMEDCVEKSDDKKAKIIIASLNNDLYKKDDNTDYSKIARAQSIFLGQLNNFIYSDKQLTTEQDAIFKNLLNDYSSQIDHVSWSIKSKSKSNKTDDVLNQRITRGLNDTRQLVISSYKKKRLDSFTKLMNVILKLDDKYNYPEDYLNRLSSPSIFMIAAYLKHRSELSSEYGSLVMGHMKNWTTQKITDVAVKSVDDDLADAWRINMQDLPADGVAHSVPNYDLVIKSLWIDLMLSHSGLRDDPDHLGGLNKFKDTLFFTNGASEDKNVDLIRMLSEEKFENNSQAEVLKTLVTRLVEGRREHETQIVRSASLSSTKIDKLIDAANKEFLDNSKVLKIFNNQLYYKSERSKLNLGYQQISINTLFDKQAFMDLENWHIGYSLDYQGEDIGRNIARSFDDNVMKTLLGGQKTSYEKYEDLLKAANSTHASWIVILNSTNEFRYSSLFNNILASGSTYDDQRLAQLNQNQAMLRTHIRDLDSGLYLIKKAHIGKIIHKESNNNPIDIDIDAYSDNKDMMDSMIESQPNWLLEKGAERHQQEAYLSTHVRLWARYVFKYRQNDSREILFLSLHKDE